MRFGANFLAAMLAASVSSVAPRSAQAAQKGAPVYCATVTCFSFHVAALGKDADARASSAMDVINKYLGGAVGKVATRPDGKNVRLLLNNEVVAIITPADAAAEKQRTPNALAAKWGSDLSRAFNASKARP